MASIRPKLRFEIFKRDGFRCQYCGRQVPDVTLEVDHIIPLHAGGTDDPENLITSCWDCNRGKGKTPIEQVPSAESRLIELEERIAQVKLFYEFQKTIETDIDQQLNDALDHWYSLPLGNWYIERPSLRRAIRSFGLSRVIEAMDISASCPRDSYWRYMCAIFRNWSRQESQNGKSAS